jgi:hypothetical protein
MPKRHGKRRVLAMNPDSEVEARFFAAFFTELPLREESRTKTK